jgi:hypothetical protein
MATSRYFFQPTIDNKFYSTSSLSSRIFNAADSGALTTNLIQLTSNKRLDVLAFEAYGDASLWWIIAAASGIGWIMQLTPGTYVRIPADINAVYDLMRS